MNAFSRGTSKQSKWHPGKNLQRQSDSDSASEHQADVNRDAERVEADKAKRQSRSDSDASRDLGRADVGRSGAERQAEGDERLRVERETSDVAIDAERFRDGCRHQDGPDPASYVRQVFR